jgi:dTDP-4-dehydrorhamnose 3,5-epimerase
MIIDKVTELAIPGVKLIHFGEYVDDRGYFCEPYRESALQSAICEWPSCVQVNQSYSRKNVVRGLHIQTDPPMGKLVRVIDGEMFDLCLDLRNKSPTFGIAIAVEMWPGRWIWVPPGIAHGNFFLQPTTIEYLCTAEYSLDAKSGSVNVYDRKIKWIRDEVSDRRRLPKKRDAVMSDRDRNAPTLAQWMEAHP